MCTNNTNRKKVSYTGLLGYWERNKTKEEDKARQKKRVNQEITTKVPQSSRKYLCSGEENSQMPFLGKPVEHLPLSLTFPLSALGKTPYQPSVENKISFRFQNELLR